MLHINMHIIDIGINTKMKPTPRHIHMIVKSNYTNMELERNTFSSNMNVMKDELNEMRRKLELHEAEKRAEITKGSQKKSNSSSSENLEKDNAIKSLRSQLNSVKVVNEQLKFNIRELQNSHSITIKKLEQIHRDNLTSVEISFANNIEKYKSRIDELTRVNGELTKINATLSVAGPSASPLRKSGDDQRSYNRYTTNDINKLNRDRNQWLRELNIIRSENGELKRQIDSLNKLLEKSRNEIKQIRSKYNSLETQKDYENGDLFAGMEENLDAAVSRCKELFDEKLRLENDIQRLMEEGAMNRDKIHRQNYDIEKLKNTIQENLDKQFDLINNGYRYDDDDDDNCSGGVAVLKSRITNLESQIIELSADIEYRDGNIASLEKERDDLKQKYNNEKRNSRNASDGVAKLKINMKKSELERDKFREKCLKSDNIIMELKRQLEINNVDLERIRDERNEYQEKVKFLDAEILTNRNKFEEQTNALNNMLRQYSRRSINNSNPSLNDTRKLHMQLQLQIETLNNQLDTVKSERKIVLEEVIRLNHQIDTLKQIYQCSMQNTTILCRNYVKNSDSKLEYLLNSHRDELKEYQDMLNISEAKLIQSEKQYQQLMADNSSAATEMRALEKRLASEMNRYQEELSQKDAIISQLKSVIEPMQREIENLNTSRRNLQYNINNTTNDSELTTSSSSSNNMLLYDKIKQLENELNRYKESERAWRNERDLLVSKMRNTVGANDLSLQSRIRTLEMDNKNLRENLQANNSTIANERANYIQQLDKLNEEIDMNNREMGKLQVEIASLNNQLNASNVLNESQIEKINRQNEELNSNLTEINALRDELNKRESDILVANRELNVLRRRVEKYKSSTTPSSEEKLTTPKRMQYVKTIKTLRKEIADNKRQIKNLIRDRSQNDDHINQLRVNDQLLNVINSLKNQIRESNGEIKMYERKLYESNRQNVKLNDNMKRVVGENESLNNRIKSIYNNYDKQIAEIGEEVAKKNELIKILTLSVENIESNNEDVRGDGVNTTNFFKNLLVTTIRERNDLDRKVQELQSEVFINKSRLSECQATMVQLNNDLTMRVEENKNLERVIVELRERISNNESKLQELQLEDGGRMTRIPEYDDENIRNYRLRLQQAQNIIKNNQNELSRLKNVDNDLRELRKKLLSQSGKEDNDNHISQELQNAMTQLDYSKNIIEEHVEQIQQLTAKNEDTERALNELQGDMRALEVDRSNILTENASLNDELTSMKDDIDIMQRKFTQLQNDYYSTSRELELEKEERFKCNATNVEIKQELRTLKSELLRLQKQCGGIKKCATKLQESIISGDEKLSSTVSSSSSSSPKTTTKRKRNNDDNTNDDYNNRKKVHLSKSTSRSPKRNLKRKEINNDNDASTSKNRRSSSSRTTITPPIPRSRALRLSASSIEDLKIDSKRQRLLNAGIVQDTELTDEEYDENFDRNLLSDDDTEEDIMRKRILSNPKYEFLNNTYNG
ncbi:hypothetical protein [Trichoplusia ni ascovirus 2c]|uniref:Structural protein ORF147 n=1 Tax=Trichoplusia ni ascovirus 2c TaxID=328615 RepID=Y147_TNAVC|nr:hypothetical protein TNAV2c_gp147 [Trichoplusia ni ascovirus 2c]Q06VD6.1 RecName: Full=Structural protein ORF147 [Trichoplusia ni ascovirus 2c]ABF70663.1 hypothetical protein [Trichoplusia ni ascovirus 2c]